MNGVTYSFKSSSNDSFLRNFSMGILFVRSEICWSCWRNIFFIFRFDVSDMGFEEEVAEWNIFFIFRFDVCDLRFEEELAEEIFFSYFVLMSETWGLKRKLPNEIFFHFFFFFFLVRFVSARVEPRPHVYKSTQTVTSLITDYKFLIFPVWVTRSQCMFRLVQWRNNYRGISTRDQKFNESDAIFVSFSTVYYESILWKKKRINYGWKTWFLCKNVYDKIDKATLENCLLPLTAFIMIIQKEDFFVDIYLTCWPTQLSKNTITILWLYSYVSSYGGLFWPVGFIFQNGRQKSYFNFWFVWDCGKRHFLYISLLLQYVRQKKRQKKNV